MCLKSWRVFAVLGALVIGLTTAGMAGSMDSMWDEGFDEPQAIGGTLYTTCLAGYFNMVPPNQLMARVLNWPVYEPIIQTMWDGTKYVPAVAEDWEVSSDNKVFTFYLREDAYWHDGESVTAEDVVFTYETLLHPDIVVVSLAELELIEGYDAYVNGAADSISGLVALDDHTVQMTLTAPNAEFLQGPAKAYLLPEHILGGLTPEEFAASDFWKSPIGTGPFMVTEYVPGEYVRTAKFTDYYRGEPYIDEIVVQQIPEEATEARVLALLDGSLDIADHHWQLTPEQKAQIEADPNLTVLTQPSNLVRGFTWKNTKDYLTPTVRRALMMAINTEELINAVVGYGVPCQTFVPAAVSSDLDQWSYDPSAARQMLEAEGWDFDRTLSMTTYYGSDRYRNIMLAIASYWQEIGVQCDVTLVGDFPTFSTIWHVPDGDDMCFCGIGARGSAWSTINHYIHSERVYPVGFNTWYDNPVADALMDALGLESDGDKRLELLYELEEIVHADGALSPIWADMEIRVVNNRVHNYQFNVVANMPSYFGTHLWWLDDAE